MDEKDIAAMKKALETCEAYIGKAVAEGHLEDCVVPASGFLEHLSGLLDRIGRTPR